jgi:hypothetical protein
VLALGSAALAGTAAAMVVMIMVMMVMIVMMMVMIVVMIMMVVMFVVVMLVHRIKPPFFSLCSIISGKSPCVKTFISLGISRGGACECSLKRV